MNTLQMKPLPDDIINKLLANGQASMDNEGGLDHVVVVKLFTPDAGATWLLSELDPESPDIAFGLCDLGVGEAEMGYVSMTELSEIRGALRLPVERDEHFATDLTVSQWADAARKADGSIAKAASILSAARRVQ